MCLVTFVGGLGVFEVCIECCCYHLILPNVHDLSTFCALFEYVLCTICAQFEQRGRGGPRADRRDLSLARGTLCHPEGNLTLPRETSH